MNTGEPFCPIKATLWYTGVLHGLFINGGRGGIPTFQCLCGTSCFSVSNLTGYACDFVSLMFVFHCLVPVFLNKNA